ncbi:DNA-binding storekeeper protein-relatedtranscriptional regulator [Striga asiatica]|uniref:DNA-binding storekeeper protein-relatedtranscriptional regulator n=1 Tax=Striga asiatica TaxID=4170 RepID=A0A5A7P4R9_STRAF|nr:DNA-binding storekeeper protein-relatedtranscriptional regulator [Striga asiatica]
MSRSREPEKPVSSETTSGEEENVDSSSEDIESEPESIQKSSAPPAAARKSQTRSATNPVPTDEDSGSESESESESNTRKKSQSKGKDKAIAASASPARSTRKRAVEEVNGTEPTVTKKSKNSKKAEPEASEKKQFFQRIWSEADEIALLNGIMQFRAENKSDPHYDMDAFYEFIKKDLHFDVTRSQLRDKMSKMKKKYTNNKSKGKGRTFTSQHEQEAFDLSEKVWGTEKENGVEKANGSGADTNNIERRYELGDNVPVEEEEIDKALKKLEIEEMEVYVRLFEVKTEKAKLLLKIMKSRGH